jgi:O-antigen ligase
MFAEKPILGWGPQNNHYELSLREDNRSLIQRDTHNLVLEVLSSTGLVGAFVFCGALWLCCRAAWRARSGRESVLPLALMACVMMGNMSGNWMSSKLLWLTLAYAVASERRLAVGRRTATPPANQLRFRSAVV